MTDQTPLEEAKAYLERRQDRPDHDAIVVDKPWSDDDIVITFGILRALVAQIEINDKLVAGLAAENEQMRETIKLAAKYIQPTWDATVKAIIPLWKALEPLIDPPAPERLDSAEQPSHSGRAVCVGCGGPIEYIREQANNGDVLNSWWAHVEHPADGHDALPVLKTGQAEGDLDICTVCGKRIKYLKEFVGDGVYNFEWVHEVQPLVVHAATPFGVRT